MPTTIFVQTISIARGGLTVFLNLGVNCNYLKSFVCEYCVYLNSLVYFCIPVSFRFRFFLVDGTGYGHPETQLGFHLRQSVKITSKLSRKQSNLKSDCNIIC